MLWYIKSVDKRYQTYVANRVAMIHELYESSQWKHVGTTENPADCDLRSTDKEGIKLWLTLTPFCVHSRCSLHGGGWWKRYLVTMVQTSDHSDVRSG